MKNFPFQHNGQELWYSRSLACNLIVFVKKKDGIYVLANKRGQGCEYNRGIWNLPGGFIDFDEDGIDCAIRETWEECGIAIDRKDVSFFSLDTNPRNSKRQTMVATHYAVFDEEDTRDWLLTNVNCEKGEVEDIELIHIDELERLVWMNAQLKTIHKVYNTLVLNKKI